jgi:hypothetical protein
MVHTKSAHRDLHSEQGARPEEHRGRSRNPVIKVVDVAWLEFEKPDLTRAEAFARRSASRRLCTLPAGCTYAARTAADPV